MTKLHDAADSIRRMAVKYEQMMSVAKVLEEAGSLEQLATENKAAADAAIKEAETAKADLAKAKQAINVAKQKADDIIGAANDQALAKLGEADQKAQAIIDGSIAEAAKFSDKALAAARTAEERIAGQVAQLTSTKVGLEQDLNSLQKASSAKLAEVEALEARLAKAQASIAKLLG